MKGQQLKPKHLQEINARPQEAPKDVKFQKTGPKVLGPDAFKPIFEVQKEKQINNEIQKNKKDLDKFRSTQQQRRAADNQVTQLQLEEDIKLKNLPL